MSDLPFVSSTDGYGPVERDQSVGGQLLGDGAPIRVGGQEYAKGLGVHAPSEVLIDLLAHRGGGPGRRGQQGQPGVRGRRERAPLWRSPTLSGTFAATVEVNLTRVRRLRLHVDPLGANGHDHADWADGTVAGCAS